MAVVVGVSDPLRGARVKAFLVLDAGIEGSKGLRAMSEAPE